MKLRFAMMNSLRVAVGRLNLKDGAATLVGARSRAGRLLGAFFFLGALALWSTGCSVKKMAINAVGNALAGGGGVYASDDDPELIRAAVPFSLKLIESLLAESPRHPGLLLAATSGFTQYGYAFVKQDSDELEATDLAAADVQRLRAKRLFLRARDYGLRGLETRHAGFGTTLKSAPREAVKQATPTDVPLLFWTAASWGAAISVSKDDPTLIADQLIVEALVDRALALDEDFDHGAIHSFLISYEMVRQGQGGDPAARARHHFDRAVELSKGQSASPFVSLAEAVALERQDRAEFEALLNRALGIDADAARSMRLQNLLAQKRARWLLGRADDLFLPVPKDESK